MKAYDAARWQQPGHKQKRYGQTNALRKSKRERLNELKTQRTCADCGISDFRVLDFDHLSDDKLANVADLIGRISSWERIEAEIAKCEVVCANCHRIRTYERRLVGKR